MNAGSFPFLKTYLMGGIMPNRGRTSKCGGASKAFVCIHTISVAK